MKKLLLNVYQKLKVGTKRLEKIIEYRFGQHISHNN